MAENILYNASDKTEYALMFLDIKNFKATNELFGTEGGDSILRDFYQRIGTTWRPAVTGRLDTDHFACLVLQSHINMDTLGNELKLNIQFKGRGMKLYGYCGIYYVEEGVSVTSMIDRAKLAEESILSDHVQPFAVFDDSMRRLYVDQMELMSEYETAIANEEFKVYYQPVVEATSGNLISAEALVRWVHPQRGPGFSGGLYSGAGKRRPYLQAGLVHCRPGGQGGPEVLCRGNSGCPRFRQPVLDGLL